MVSPTDHVDASAFDLTCDGTALRDRHGRLRLLRGANVSGRCKAPPFLPFDDPAWFDVLAEWGMNVVRLLVMWEAIEPERGHYDHDYLARVAALARAAGSRGLAVVIDVHQDLFSRSFGGDGAPAWAIRPGRRRANGRSWFWHYGISSGVRASFDAFWRDDGGVRSSFLAAVATTMRALADEPAVVGYDLFNEPMGRLRDLVRGRFERESLSRFHHECVALRDREAPGRLLLIEPTPLAAFGAPTALAEPRGEQLVYAPHLYDATAILAGRFMPRLSTFPPSLTRVQATAARWQRPLFVGEFGVLGGIAGSGAMIEDQCARLDRAWASWTVWHFNPTAQDWNDEDASIVLPGGEERPWTASLVRPWPRALAGTPVALETASAGPWTLQYRAHGDAATEVVVPRRWLGGRPLAATVEGADADFDESAGLLRLVAEAGTSVRVVLRR